MSWFEVAADAPFGIAELPYGVFCQPDTEPRVGVAIGDQVLDLVAAMRAAGQDESPFQQGSLNRFLARGRAYWEQTRSTIQHWLAEDSGRAIVEPALIAAAEVTLLLPIEVADYVDFYASEHHATNVGRLFRPNSEPLTPNWKHLPIGYHGRAGTVVPSGTHITRPCGQRKPPEDAVPVFGPSIRLDFEAELGFIVGQGSRLGEPVGIGDFEDHVFGVVILNDWSARDLQAWEYVPLGPFLGKSFATSISPWVLPLQALESAKIPLPAQEPELLPYLQGETWGYDLTIEVFLNGQLISSCPYALIYYSPAQFLAHLTINGASLRTGDLLGSGTISGPQPDQFGSLLELTWGGANPIPTGSGPRTFLADGDELVMRAHAGQVKLGEVSGIIDPARA